MSKYLLSLGVLCFSAIASARADGHGCIGGHGCVGGFVSNGCYGGFARNFGCYGFQVNINRGWGCYGGDAGWQPVGYGCFGGRPAGYGCYGGNGGSRVVQLPPPPVSKQEWVKQYWPGGVWEVMDGGDGQYYAAGNYWVTAGLADMGWTAMPRRDYRRVPTRVVNPAQHQQVNASSPQIRTAGPPAQTKGAPENGTAGNGKAPPAAEPEPVKPAADPGNGSEEPIGPPEEKGGGPAAAKIIVHVPQDAQLTVNGAATRSNSPQRTFVSPPLEKGRDFHYTLQAELTRDGQKLVASKRVSVRAGEEQKVVLEFAPQERVNQ